MDSIYQAVESLHFFIPIIAITVVCGTLYFCKDNPEDEEYLFDAAEEKEALRVYQDIQEIEKKQS